MHVVNMLNAIAALGSGVGNRGSGAYQGEMGRILTETNGVTNRQNATASSVADTSGSANSAPAGSGDVTSKKLARTGSAAKKRTLPSKHDQVTVAVEGGTSSFVGRNKMNLSDVGSGE